MKLDIIHGDITKLNLDAIVNAANRMLLGGGGVDEMIHYFAGKELYDECKLLPEVEPGVRCRTGQAIMTKGYNLPAKYVIHTVGPIYGDESNPSKLLADCYRNSLEIAEDNGIKSIAFPAISTGVFGYPEYEALIVVKNVIDNFKFNSVENVVLCFFSAEDKLRAEKVFYK